jgi:hypothetical protein
LIHQRAIETRFLRYDLLQWNCQGFVHDCYFGRAYSDGVRVWGLRGHCSRRHP